MAESSRRNLLLASRDPAIVRLARSLSAVGIPVEPWSPDQLPDPDKQTEGEDSGTRRGDMFIVGAEDLFHLAARRPGFPWQGGILLGLPSHRLSMGLATLSRLQRPRPGDAIAILDRPHQTLPALIALADAGYIALPPTAVDEMVVGLSRKKSVESLPLEDQSILAMLARGRTNAEIAAEIGWPESQVKTRLRVMMGKLGLPNRTAAAVVAFKLGLAE
jgi:DNA-binding CsgD family transcriptional regulator